MPGDGAVGVELRLVTSRRGVVFLRGPLAEVDGVRAPFEDAAAVEVEVAAPVAANVSAVVRAPRAGAEPAIPVAFVDRRFRFRVVPVVMRRRPKGVRVNFGEFAEFAALDDFGGEHKVADVAALRPGLIDDAVAFDRVGEGAAFLNREGKRFFAVDVFPELRGGDGGHRVPTVAGRDQDGVDIVASEEVFHILIDGAIGIVVFFIGLRFQGVAANLANVANGADADVFATEEDAEVVSAAGADTDPAEVNLSARRSRAVEPEDFAGNVSRNERRGSGDRATFQKVSTTDASLR